MQTLSATAERLRTVRRAHEHFLSLWALECLMHRNDPLDKVVTDVNRLSKDSQGHDWSDLYRGSVLDD